MKATCGNCACSQGRSCPVRTTCYATYRSPARRLLDHWVVAAMIYAVPAALFIAINLPLE